MLPSTLTQKVVSMLEKKLRIVIRDHRQEQPKMDNVVFTTQVLGHWLQSVPDMQAYVCWKRGLMRELDRRDIKPIKTSGRRQLA